MNFSDIRKNLQNKTAGIAGAGGLGSNCAAALARCGIGRLVIADFDVVSESNLNRQFFFRSNIQSNFDRRGLYLIQENAGGQNNIILSYVKHIRPFSSLL
jgi:shikimate 5-dehydrogenase